MRHRGAFGRLLLEVIRAVFVKRVANRGVVSLDLASRRKPILAIPAGLAEADASSTSRAIALEVARRIGVPVYEA